MGLDALSSPSAQLESDALRVHDEHTPAEVPPQPLRYWPSGHDVEPQLAQPPRSPAGPPHSTAYCPHPHDLKQARHTPGDHPSHPLRYSSPWHRDEVHEALQPLPVVARDPLLAHSISMIPVVDVTAEGAASPEASSSRVAYCSQLAVEQLFTVSLPAALAALSGRIARVTPDARAGAISADMAPALPLVTPRTDPAGHDHAGLDAPIARSEQLAVAFAPW